MCGHCAVIRYNMTDGQKEQVLHFIQTLKEVNMCGHCVVIRYNMTDGQKEQVLHFIQTERSQHVWSLCYYKIQHDRWTEGTGPSFYTDSERSQHV